MTHILFVCHGNICRSPMAEFIMKALIRKAGCEKAITVDSVAATTEEIGNDMYPPAKRMLAKKGIPFSPRRARLITASDYARADYILCMDEENLADLARIALDHRLGSVQLISRLRSLRKAPFSCQMELFW